MKKLLTFLLLVVSLYTLTACQQANQNARQQPAQEQSGKMVKNITAEEASKHDNIEDCWLIVEGKVYDVTTYIAMHPPGVESIIEGCGIDATTLYETRPMGTGTPHSEKANKLLEEYYIGDVQ